MVLTQVKCSVTPQHSGSLGWQSLKVLGPVTSEMAAVSRYPVSTLGGRQGLKVPGPKGIRWTAGFEGTRS